MSDRIEDVVAEMKKHHEAAERDPETGHVDADALLCRLLREHGYGEVVDIFDDMRKWYA